MNLPSLWSDGRVVGSFAFRRFALHDAAKGLPVFYALILMTFASVPVSAASNNCSAESFSSKYSYAS